MQRSVVIDENGTTSEERTEPDEERIETVVREGREEVVEEFVQPIEFRPDAVDYGNVCTYEDEYRMPTLIPAQDPEINTIMPLYQSAGSGCPTSRGTQLAIGHTHAGVDLIRTRSMIDVYWKDSQHPPIAQ